MKSQWYTKQHFFCVIWGPLIYTAYCVIRCPSFFIPYINHSRMLGLKRVFKHQLKLRFPTGRDFLVPRDKGSEFPSLSRDKGTTGQKSHNCPGTKGQWVKPKSFQGMGRDGILTLCHWTGLDGKFWHPVPSRNISETAKGQKGKKSGFVPGRSGTEDFVPGFFNLP